MRLESSKPTSPPTAKRPIHLPSEIIYQILSHFTAADAARSEGGSYRTYCSLCHLQHLYTCCLISKIWNKAATGILYSNLKLDLDGTCEYHWRGIPWRDGKVWWRRRHSYLNDRYLKPLLRTLTLRQDLANCFRTIEIDIHDHMKPDYKALPLYAELIALCPNLKSIIGDPCIFFCPNHNFPSCQESFSNCLINRLSSGYINSRAHARILKQQQKLQKVLSNCEFWESWEIDRCQGMQSPFISADWKNLKHLSFKDFSLKPEIYDTTALLLGSLVSLESLSLTNTSLDILRLVPGNKLIVLTIKNPDFYVSNWSSLGDMKELWAYLSQGKGPSSRLQRLSISIPARHATLTKKRLSKTLSLAPNLRELRLSTHHEVERNCIVLKGDLELDEFQQQPFPICAKLQKLWYLFPGWTHNELLVELLSKEGAFPALRDVVCFRSSVVVELKEPADWYPPMGLEARRVSKTEGARVDRDLESELIGKRGMDWVYDLSMEWRRTRFRRDVKTGYT